MPMHKTASRENLAQVNVGPDRALTNWGWFALCSKVCSKTADASSICLWYHRRSMMRRRSSPPSCRRGLWNCCLQGHWNVLQRCIAAASGDAHDMHSSCMECLLVWSRSLSRRTEASKPSVSRRLRGTQTHLCAVFTKTAANQRGWLSALIRWHLSAKARADAAIPATIFADGSIRADPHRRRLRPEIS